MHVWSISQNKEPIDEALCIHFVLFIIEHLSKASCVPVVHTVMNDSGRALALLH